MKKNIIHMTPEERLANSSNEKLSAVDTSTREVTNAVNNLNETSERSANASTQEIGGKLKETNDKLGGIKENSEKQLQQSMDSTKETINAIKPSLEAQAKMANIMTSLLTNLEGPDGPKGDKGDSIKGDKGEPGKDAHMVGPKGEDGVDGKDSKVPGPQGKPGKISTVPGPRGRDGVKGARGSADEPDDVVAKVNAAKKKIESNQVSGLKEAMRQITTIGSNPTGVSGGGGRSLRIMDTGTEVSAHLTELNFTSNLTVTYDGDGRVSVAGDAGGAVEGTEVLSTGEVGGTKFLREDGDGTSSWQTPAGGGDVVGPASSTNNAIARFDSTTGKLIQNSGVTIADSNAIVTNIADGANGIGLTVNQNDTTNNPVAAQILNAGTGNSLFLDQDGEGIALSIDSEATSASSIGVEVGSVFTGFGSNSVVHARITNVSSTGGLMNLDNAGSGDGLFIDQDGNGVALSIDSEATSATAISVDMINTHTGAGLSLQTEVAESVTLLRDRASGNGTSHFFRNLGSASTTGPVVFIEQDHASDDQTTLAIQQDGTGKGIRIDQNGNAVSLDIDSEATTSPAITVNIVDGDAHIRLETDSGNATPTEGDFWRESDGLKYYDGTTEHNLLAGLENVSEDTTPQLGGDLDVAGNDIVSVSNGDINFIPNGSGIVKGFLKRFMVQLLADDADNATGTTLGGDFRISNRAITIKDVGAYVDTAGTTGTQTIDINEAGTSILSTKITLDSTEKSSETAATPPVISDSAIAADAIVTIDVDAIQTTAAKGLKIWVDYIYA